MSHTRLRTVLLEPIHAMPKGRLVSPKVAAAVQELKAELAAKGLKYTGVSRSTAFARVVNDEWVATTQDQASHVMTKIDVWGRPPEGSG